MKEDFFGGEMQVNRRARHGDRQGFFDRGGRDGDACR